MPAKKSTPAKKLAVLVTLIERRIYLIRGRKVMIDSDLAELYGVETKILNRGVRRNLERFPEDFMFQLTKDEAESLRIQFGTLEPAGRGQHRKYLPYVYDCKIKQVWAGFRKTTETIVSTITGSSEARAQHHPEICL